MISFVLPSTWPKLIIKTIILHKLHHLSQVIAQITSSVLLQTTVCKVRLKQVFEVPTLQPWAEMILRSAGILSPPFTSTKSPTTTSSALMLFFSPSRTTRACYETKGEIYVFRAISEQNYARQEAVLSLKRFCFYSQLQETRWWLEKCHNCGNAD